MFNQLTPTDIVGAIGVTLRDAARSEDRSDEFSRDQLLSAYSATRHLAVELSSYGAEFAAFTHAVAGRIRADADGDLAELRTQTAARIDGEPDVAIVGAALADLLAVLRDDDSPTARALRAEIHALLRGLADREVDLLADALR
jgi:hypothetical protein